LNLRYGAAHGIGGTDTAHITIRRCDIPSLVAGISSPDSTVSLCVTATVSSFGVRHDTIWFEHCRIWEIYDAALTNQGNDPASVQEDITYRHNVVWIRNIPLNIWNRPETARTENVIFENNTCVDAGCGWGHSQRPDPNGRHLMFWHNSAPTTGIVVRDNYFCNSTDSCFRMDNDWLKGLNSDRKHWFQKERTLFCYLGVIFSARQVEELPCRHRS